jgi:predicted MFS family arabinose efflux permease
LARLAPAADPSAAPRLTSFVRALVDLYRNAFGGLPAVTWLLCTAAFLNRMGSMVVPLLGPFLAATFAFTPEQSGYVIALYGVGAFVGSWLGGVLTDRWGPVRLQIVALGSSAAWMLAMTQLRTAELFVPGVFVLGVLNDAFRPGSNTAAAVSVPPELRRKALSLNRFALNLGWAFGPTIGGYLVAVDFRLMFVADGATCALAALWLAFGLRGFNPPPPPKPVATAAATGPAIAARPEHPLRDRHFLWLMAANLLVLLAFMQYFTTGPRVFQDQGFDTVAIGWLLAINPTLITVAEMPVVHVLRRHAALPAVACGSALVGLGYLTMHLPGAALPAVLAMVVVAIGEVLQMPMLGSHVNDHAPDHVRGTYNGAYGMTFTLALVLAPIVGSHVYQAYGANLLWLSCTASGLLGASMFALAAMRRRR